MKAEQHIYLYGDIMLCEKLKIVATCIVEAGEI